MRIIIGSDHAGFDLKCGIVTYLTETGHSVEDIGTYTPGSCDYPDFAKRVAEGVLAHTADRGIMVDGVGASSAIVANKFPGIRAVPCHNEFTVTIARQHSDSNVLCLGAKLSTLDEAKPLIDAWLSIPPLQEKKYKNRLNKISMIEHKNFSSHLLTHTPSSVKHKQVVTEDDVRRAVKENRPLYVRKNTLYTPSARDLIKDKNVPTKQIY